MERINIELVPYTEDYLILCNGKYLVRTVSTSKLETIQYLEARCKVTYSEKQKRNITSIDVNNQRVTHISLLPINK